ncbi:substrate-binding periplasmic protein [Paucidesulfovibrio longus]|uniref:substrate-binding periplasmic protein n=1 Tax=Paucidesulfovibrio longus TaxID=889 RepID=UPI0003B2F1A6|nr:transporter substrate-binding domain-containing protein [Paucidesulfovibrio longus]
MRTQLLLCLLGLLGLIVPAAASAGRLDVLRVAAPERQPFFFRVQDEPAGLEADVLSELAESLRLDLEFVPCAGEQCRAMLADGRADLGSGVQDEPGLSAKLLFVRPAYAVRPDAVFYRLREAPPVTGQLRLRGKKLGVRSGSPLPKDIATDRLIPLVRQDSAARLMKLLLAGTVDLVMLDENEGDAVLHALHLDRNIVKCEYRLKGGEPLFFAFSLRSKQLARAGAFENRLRDMVESGRLRELQDRHLKGGESK